MTAIQTATIQINTERARLNDARVQLKAARADARKARSAAITECRAILKGIGLRRSEYEFALA